MSQWTAVRYFCLFCERVITMQSFHSVRDISYMIKSKFVLCTKVIKSSHGIAKKKDFVSFVSHFLQMCFLIFFFFKFRFRSSDKRMDQSEDEIWPPLCCISQNSFISVFTFLEQILTCVLSPPPPAWKLLSGSQVFLHTEESQFLLFWASVPASSAHNMSPSHIMRCILNVHATIHYFSYRIQIRWGLLMVILWTG